MKKYVIGTVVISLLLPLSSSAFAATKAPRPGAPCKSVGQTIDTGTKVYTCVKSGNKLLWNRGIAHTTSPFKVGMIYCKTGTFAAAGDAYLQGWKSGLKWVTGGKVNAQGLPVINGRPIQIVDISDDKSTDVTAALTAFEDQAARGAKAILGTCSSEIAIEMAKLAESKGVFYFPGTATDDVLSGINRWTFRTGRQFEQDVLSALSLIPVNSSVAILADQERLTLAAQRAASDRGLTLVAAITLPSSAVEIAARVRQIRDAKPDFLLNLSELESAWREIRAQRVLREVDVVTILNASQSWNLIGALGGENFLYSAHYIAAASGTKEEAALIRDLTNVGKIVDQASVDGFTAALLVARAAKADLTGVDAREKIWKSLEGYSFNSVKGRITVRSQDHALLQPMFHARLRQTQGGFKPLTVGRVDLVKPALARADWASKP
jgi:branched-chain amino acid transport system substrate-binding protein